MQIDEGGGVRVRFNARLFDRKRPGQDWVRARGCEKACVSQPAGAAFARIRLADRELRSRFTSWDWDTEGDRHRRASYVDWFSIFSGQYFPETVTAEDVHHATARLPLDYECEGDRLALGGLVFKRLQGGVADWREMLGRDEPDCQQLGSSLPTHVASATLETGQRLA